MWESVRRGRKSYPFAGAEHELYSSPRRWPLCLWSEERGMATSASPATAVLLTVLLISCFSATLASRSVRGKTFLLLRKGLWSALAPLCCASECLLGIFALTVLKLSNLGAASSSIRRYQVIQISVLPHASCLLIPGSVASPASPATQNPNLVPPGALGLARREPLPGEPCGLAPAGLLGCSGPPASLLVGLHHAVSSKRIYLINQRLAGNQSKAVQQM